MFTAFAFKEGYETSLQTGRKASGSTVEMYMENIFVALSSAGRMNPGTDLVLAVNVLPPQPWQELFRRENINCRVIPFDSFVLPKSFSWSLAFYKLCAMKTLVEEGDYDRYLLLDNDTFTTGSYDELWMEAGEAVLLYPVGHSYHHHDREIIHKEWDRLYPGLTGNPVHYGGEFVAGSRGKLRKFLALTEDVFERMRKIGFNMDPATGDESVWSMAAELASREGLPIRTGGAYLFRFWTGTFYLVSTVTTANPVCIWHVPNEKETGFRRLFQYIQEKGQFPESKKAAAMLGIAVPKRPFNKYTLMNKVNGKCKITNNQQRGYKV